MNIKGKLKKLAAAFLAVAGTLAPFGAWAVDGEWSPVDSSGTKYKIRGFMSLSDISLRRPDKHPGILLTWSFYFLREGRLPNGAVASITQGYTWDQFTVWRDGKEIGKVNDTRWPFYYRDIDAVPGESYTYFVSSSLGPAYSPPITQLCYMNYDAWAEKEMFHLGKKGGEDSVKVCVQKKEVTSISEQGVGISASLAEWTATSNSDWLKLSGANNLNPGTNSILFTVNPNETGEARTAIISIGVPAEDGMVVKKITVVQEATDLYSIRFIRNDGAGTLRTVEFNYGEKTRMPSLAKGLGWARRGYEFKGWALTTADAAAGKVWKCDWAYVSTPVKADGVLTVYAVWELKPGYYQIRYNKNDGTGKWRALGYEYGVSTKLPTIKALNWTVSGKTFKGWATSAANASTGKVWKTDGAAVSTAAAEGKTLSIYAIWE